MPQTLEATTETVPGLWEVLARVDRIAAESLEPEEEGDTPVSPEVAEKARNLIVQTASQAQHMGVTWIRPSVATTPNGEILASWRKDGHSLSLIAGLNPDIVLISKEPNHEPVRQVRGVLEAMGEIIAAFRRMSLD